MDLYYVEVIWRYAEGHQQTAIHQTRIKACSAESAEVWAGDSVRRKFSSEDIEIIKSTATYLGS